MRSMNKLTLSRQAVDRLPVADREVVFWDQHLPGFGLRVYPSGKKVYMVHTRAAGSPGASPSAATGCGRRRTRGARRARSSRASSRARRRDGPARTPRPRSDPPSRSWPRTT